MSIDSNFQNSASHFFFETKHHCKRTSPILFFQILCIYLTTSPSFRTQCIPARPRLERGGVEVTIWVMKDYLCYRLSIKHLDTHTYLRHTHTHIHITHTLRHTHTQTQTYLKHIHKFLHHTKAGEWFGDRLLWQFG